MSNENKPKFLYRGITIRYEMLKNFQFYDVDLNPLNPPIIDENGRKLIGDGNEYGVYMTDHDIVARNAYAKVEKNDGTPLNENIMFGSDKQRIMTPAIGIVYKIDTTGLDVHMPWVTSYLKGHYNNGMGGNEWIAESVPASNYSIDTIEIGPDILHDSEMIKIEDITKVKEIITKKIEDRKERLELFEQRMEFMPTKERFLLDSSKIEILKEIYKIDGIMDIDISNFEPNNPVDYLNYLMAVSYSRDKSKIDFTTLSYIQSLKNEDKGLSKPEELIAIIDNQIKVNENKKNEFVKRKQMNNEEYSTRSFDKKDSIYKEIKEQIEVKLNVKNDINENTQENNELGEQTMVINGRNVEVKREKGNDFVKTTRSLNGVEINSSKEYEDGSYDKKSRVFVADKGIKISSDYINYTTYIQKYDAKTLTYTDREQTPLIDKNGNVIGEQESIEILNSESGERQTNSFTTIENENGNYYLERNYSGSGEEFKETSTLMIDNKLSGNKEKIQYINDNDKETYIYMEDGVIGQKITKTDRGTTIDVYKDGKPDATYEYDENGKAIIQMAGLEQLPDDYVKNCFDLAIPEYEIVVHKEPEEIYMIDNMQSEAENNTKQVVATQKLGKETVDIQKDIEKIDEVEKQMEQQVREQSKENEGKFEINEFGEIIRPERKYRTATDEYVDEILNQFEKDLENGVFEQEEMKKKYSHKVEKGDDDYIM